MIVERFSTFGEAAVARSALEAAGIGADVYDEYFVSYDWRFSNGLGGVKVAVSPEDFDEAADILDFEAQPAPETVEPLAEGAPDAVDEVTLRCPECESDAVTRIPRVLIFGALSLACIGVGVALGELALGLAGVMAMALVALFTPSHRCTSCGERFTPPSAEREEPRIEAVILPDVHCPYCGSAELHRVYYRRLKAASMFFAPLFVPLFLVWLLLPKWKCDTCHRTS